MKTANLILTCILTVVFAAMVGCASTNHGQAAEIAINAGGTHTDRSSVYATVAAQGVAVAKPRTDAAGQLVLSGVEKNLSGVLAENDLAKAEDVKALNQVHALEEEDARSKAEVVAIKKQWGYRFQIWVTWAFWILMGLIAIHLIAGAIASLWPLTPWGTAAGLVSKIINPFGWITWLVSSSEKQQALKLATAGSKSNPIGI